MKLTCSQFEGLITFYLDGELSKSLTQAFEQHMKECPACNMKFKVIKSIIGDIKSAYDKILSGEDESCIEAEPVAETVNSDDEYVTMSELSAYMDNELPDENSVKVRRNIIARPKMRGKLEKMYRLRKILSDSFVEQKNKLKTDYSKDIIKRVNTEITPRQICLHCILFLLIVVLSVIASVVAIVMVL